MRSEVFQSCIYTVHSIHPPGCNAVYLVVSALEPSTKGSTAQHRTCQVPKDQRGPVGRRYAPRISSGPRQADRPPRVAGPEGLMQLQVRSAGGITCSSHYLLFDIAATSLCPQYGCLSAAVEVGLPLNRSGIGGISD